MSKNKLKCLLFFIAVLSLFVFSGNKIKANEYEVSVSSISGLYYGNQVSSAKINARSDIDGVFSFYNPDVILSDVGNISLDVAFTPYDLETYTPKKITIEAEVMPRVISIVFETPIYKQYDGSTNISLPKYSYVGILNDEVSVVGDLQATLSGSYVGEGIDVNLTGVTIEGEKIDCYKLDLLNHSARIYPLYLEKSGENKTQITLDKNVYVDTGYSLKVIKEKVNELVNDKYTSFLKYTYNVYNHNNVILDVEGNFEIMMEIDEKIIQTERLTVYELTRDGEYKEIRYSYLNGNINCSIASDSSLVFATRNIEWNLIYLFSGILVFSVVFIMAYRYKNSKIKVSKSY